MDIFTIAAASRSPAQALPAGKSIRALKARVKTAAKSYLSRGNAAVDRDWGES